ncbi:tRNA (adenosine(37)-N6)-dimethylallyltransferase MiaA [Marivirga salinae]|uniref:tRNA dimethylallyltransferase n=1 Tax=Marivirga salinarum TaxID=3059078 RepID=A0AA51NCX9_9BACT|nr:tRNA (adenosine(37)-N6)-dimethylallyltransferase MiaA [Marivirga sp. BDSF4-3]WMN11305.1 tRNA (adenosine(37)-N6)-dimethylallyltransferase MiaA [Marivirga sp. BDSF4-3]
MTKKSKTIVILAGPTAVGKTSLSIQLAKRFKTEIISADSRQFYKEMVIGTAKPTSKEMDGVPHHFINSHSIQEDYNVGQFEKDALNLLGDLFRKHDIIFVVGGSGLYVKALCEGIDDMPSIPVEIRQNLNAEFEQNGIECLQKQVMESDPEYFEIVDQQNPQRLIRALELYRATGKNMSYYRAQEKQIERPFNIIKIGLERPREELYDRINLRMDQMIAEGLFDEAEKLYHYKNLNALQTLGYSEIFGFLDGEYDREEAVRLLKRNSRRYAKRQMTWFKRDSEFVWFKAEDKDKVIDYLESRHS